MSYFWLSFRDSEENKNLGVCIVKASNFDEGITKAWSLNINPGGEVLGMAMTETQTQAQGLEINRLYTKAEMNFEKLKERG